MQPYEINFNIFAPGRPLTDSIVELWLPEMDWLCVTLNRSLLFFPVQVGSGVWRASFGSVWCECDIIVYIAMWISSVLGPISINTRTRPDQRLWVGSEVFSYQTGPSIARFKL